MSSTPSQPTTASPPSEIRDETAAGYRLPTDPELAPYDRFDRWVPALFLGRLSYHGPLPVEVSYTRPAPLGKRGITPSDFNDQLVDWLGTNGGSGGTRMRSRWFVATGGRFGGLNPAFRAEIVEGEFYPQSPYRGYEIYVRERTDERAQAAYVGGDDWIWRIELQSRGGQFVETLARDMVDTREMHGPAWGGQVPPTNAAFAWMQDCIDATAELATPREFRSYDDLAGTALAIVPGTAVIGDDRVEQRLLLVGHPDDPPDPQRLRTVLADRSRRFLATNWRSWEDPTVSRAGHLVAVSEIVPISALE